MAAEIHTDSWVSAIIYNGLVIWSGWRIKYRRHVVSGSGVPLRYNAIYQLSHRGVITTTPTLYSLRIASKKFLNTLLHKPDKTDPRQRINPYVTEIKMGRIDPELRKNPYGRPGGSGEAVTLAPGLNIPGVTTRREVEQEQPPVVKEPSFIGRMVEFAIGDIINIFERIYQKTDTYKRRKKEKMQRASKAMDERARREQFERLSRGER